MIWFLVSAAFGNVDCNAIQEPCTEDLTEVLESIELEPEEEEAPSVEPYAGLPAGPLTADDLEEAWAYFHEQGTGLTGVFSALADGQERLLPGAVVKELIERAGADIGLLPLDKLVDVYSDGSVMDFQFDFDGESTFSTETPETTIYYLKNGELYSKEQSSRTVKVKENLQIEISPNGIEGIRRGDLKISGFKVGIRTEVEPGRVLTHKGYPVVAVDENGEPIVNDAGEYVVQVYDDWMVIDPPMGSDVWIGVPTI
ncbi:MAG: hypothetical protein VX519_11710 [Myxococcota bacterium]|nr:hypothetical protein [Myxococcota bacterium]